MTHNEGHHGEHGHRHGEPGMPGKDDPGKGPEKRNQGPAGCRGRNPDGCAGGHCPGHRSARSLPISRYFGDS